MKMTRPWMSTLWVDLGNGICWPHPDTSIDAMSIIPAQNLGNIQGLWSISNICYTNSKCGLSMTLNLVGCWCLDFRLYDKLNSIVRQSCTRAGDLWPIPIVPMLFCSKMMMKFMMTFIVSCTVPADIGLPTGNGKKLSCSQAQLGQATYLAVA